MTTIKQFLLLGFLFLSVFAKAQSAFLPDEIWYDTGKNIYVQFCLPTVYDVSKYADDTKTFADLYAMNLPEKNQKSVTDKKISIKIDELKNESSIRTSEDFDIVNIFPSEFYQGDTSNFQELKLITKEGEKINCYFRNLDELVSFLRNDWGKSINSISTAINSDVAGFKRKPVILLYQNKDGQIQNIAKNTNTQVNNLDQLQLTGSAGINFFKSRFLPSFKFHLGLVFSQKGIYKDHYFVDYEIMYDFATVNNQLSTKTGHFIDLGYKRNFGKTPEKSDWYGVSAGYLIHKKSDVFDDHTWRISVYRNITKNIQLVPQIYFPENFSKVFPGLNLNISF